MQLYEMLKNNILKKGVGIDNIFKIKALSRKSTVDKETLSRILNGKTKNPGVYTITKIANVLNCSIDDLIAEEGEDKNAKLKVSTARHALTITADLLCQEEHKVNFGEFLCVLKQIYTHSLNKKVVDTKFATQCVKDFLKAKDAKG